jgi:hypothetical protein
MPSVGQLVLGGGQGGLKVLGLPGQFLVLDRQRTIGVLVVRIVDVKDAEPAGRDQ